MTAQEYADEMPEKDREEFVRVVEAIRVTRHAFAIDGWALLGMRVDGLMEPTWPLALTPFGAEVAAILQGVHR